MIKSFMFTTFFWGLEAKQKCQAVIGREEDLEDSSLDREATDLGWVGGSWWRFSP